MDATEQRVNALSVHQLRWVATRLNLARRSRMDRGMLINAVLHTFFYKSARAKRFGKDYAPDMDRLLCGAEQE